MRIWPEALERAPVSSEQAQDRAPVAAPTTFERIAKALDEGRIGLKESVLLRAKLLFAPRMVPPQSEFAPRPGEKVAEKYWTGFIKDVHRVKDLLSQDEKALLRSLDPNLDAIVRSWEGVPGGPAQISPAHPDVYRKGNQLLSGPLYHPEGRPRCSPQCGVRRGGGIHDQPCRQ